VLAARALPLALLPLAPLSLALLLLGEREDSRLPMEVLRRELLLAALLLSVICGPAAHFRLFAADFQCLFGHVSCTRARRNNCVRWEHRRRWRAQGWTHR